VLSDSIQIHKWQGVDRGQPSPLIIKILYLRGKGRWEV
jgi:hypothetical protein